MAFYDDLPEVFDEDFDEFWDEIDEVVEEGRRIVQRAPKRYVRDALDPLEYYNGDQFKRRFRFSKDSMVHYILPLLMPNLVKENNRGLPISPLYQLLVTMRFYATGSFQTVSGDLAFVSQASVSRIVAHVSRLLALLLPQYVKFPTDADERRVNNELFQQMGSRARGPNEEGHPGIPGVDGAIDCTHIKIAETRGQQFREVFRNRKGWFSINVQAICGPRMEFLDVVSRWAGSTHDSRIFQNSQVNTRYMTRQLTGILLGDGGYPTLPYLMTPFRAPATEAEQRYNKAQIKGRNVIERVFGVWKRRFPCLSKGLTTKLETSATIIIACAVLHNMSLIVDGELPPDEVPFDEENEDEDDPPALANIVPGEGFAVRNNIVRNIFTE